MAFCAKLLLTGFEGVRAGGDFFTTLVARVTLLEADFAPLLDGLLVAFVVDLLAEGLLEVLLLVLALL
ncbi:hypothetical protein F3D3_4721 [Fusibacter sp. 3D3]|nr:hypothetical protein F3D3_4721 [Fusibacter sp. 3D3]